MTDHLPECPVYGHTLIDPGGMSWLPERKKSRIREANARACICPELRACEQRVREEIDREAFVLDEGDPFRQVYRKGLDAARKAVGDLPHPMIDVECECGACAALAAIDALRLKP